MSNDYAILYKVDGFETSHTKYLSGDNEHEVREEFIASDFNNQYKIDIIEIVNVHELDNKIVAVSQS